MQDSPLLTDELGNGHTQLPVRREPGQTDSTSANPVIESPYKFESAGFLETLNAYIDVTTWCTNILDAHGTQFKNRVAGITRSQNLGASIVTLEHLGNEAVQFTVTRSCGKTLLTEGITRYPNFDARTRLNKQQQNECERTAERCDKKGSRPRRTSLPVSVQSGAKLSLPGQTDEVQRKAQGFIALSRQITRLQRTGLSRQTRRWREQTP